MAHNELRAILRHTRNSLPKDTIKTSVNYAAN